MTADRIAITREPLESADAQTLIAALNAELDARYPEEGANHFRLDPDEVAPGRGAFVIARLDGRPVACGAVRRGGDDCAEIKRMYVDPSARGHGLGRRVLAALEVEAGLLGARRLLLETGARQHEAVGLYVAAGYVVVDRFGAYLDSPLSLCMGKDL